jgi:hypothetical protein
MKGAVMAAAGILRREARILAGKMMLKLLRLAREIEAKMKGAHSMSEYDRQRNIEAALRDE